MATLGRWTGGTTTLLPVQSWLAPNGLFPTQQRNDSSAYSFTSSTSTLTLPSSGLADGYLLIAHFEFEDGSSGRHNPQGKIVQLTGTGNFVGGPTGGFNRDASEDRSFVRCWAFVDNPSASSTYQFQWKRDLDAPTGGTVISAFEVIPFYYSNHGIYSSTSSSLYGGTSPNQVTGFTAVDQSDTAAIEIVSNVITLKGDNKRYLCLGSQFFESRGGRTQRGHGFEVDGTKEDAAKAYSYYRNSSNDESGEMFTWLIDRATTNITIEQFCYRGDGVSAGQGGANIDGSTPNVGDHAIVILELNDSAEVFRSENTTKSGDLNVTGPVDLNCVPSGGVAFNDSASWVRQSDTTMRVQVACDALLGSNVSAAQEVVSTSSRWTARSHFTVNGTEDNDTRAGEYARNNQGSQDTFGWSANLMSFIALSANDDVGVSVQELAGGEDGGRYETQIGWNGFWGINLDTLQAGGEDVTITAEAGSYSWSGANVNILEALRIDAAAGSYAWAGQDAGIMKNFIVSAESGSYTWAGQDSNILVDQVIAAAAGSYAWAGQNAEILRSLLLASESGSFTWAGQDANILKAIPISAEPGSYAWAGQAAELIRDLTISAESGVYTWAGGDASLVRSLLMAAEAASYGWAGQDANITLSALIDAESGAYTWSGQDAALLLDHIIQAESGAYAWAGQDVAINIAGITTIIAEAGVYGWSGQDTEILLDRIINAEAGAWTWNGQEANLVLSGAAVRPPQEDFHIGIRIGI